MLESRGLSPRHRFGQNFLVDQNHIRRLVDASGVGAGNVVLEVGPGTGTMTEELLARGAAVVAAEIDAGLCALLRERLSRFGERFVLVEGDVLESKRSLAGAMVEAVRGAMGRSGRDRFVLVSNLPYAAGTPVMATLLADHPECAGVFVTVQREVADRLMASPGSKDFGPLGVLAQAVGEVTRLAVLPPSCFWPRPEVTSAMVSIVRLATPRTRDPRGLFDACQRLFSSRRKQLGAVLAKRAGPDPWEGLPAGVTPTMRAEALKVEQIVALVEGGWVRGERG